MQSQESHIFVRGQTLVGIFIVVHVCAMKTIRLTKHLNVYYYYSIIVVSNISLPHIILKIEF